MNKSELVEAVASATDLNKQTATRAVDALLDAVTTALSRGDAVNVAGFGSFVVKERAARTGRNPRTGETLEIGASRSVGFKAGKAMKDALS
jgi:DNA-binding protein HU-beta